MEIIKRVRKSIENKTARKLWVSSAGRCQYDGCNISLLEDALTKRGINKAYISHIIAASPDGPRGDKVLSEELEIDYSNLMLLCDECHNRIDESDVDGHTVEILRKMKKDHEDRIELVTSLTPNKATHIVFLGANIGEHSSPLVFEDASNAIIPLKFPSESRPYELSLKQLSFYDNDVEYWLIESKSLIRQYESKLKVLKESSKVQHYSIFALAPQPLLILLGTLLNDLYNVDIFQLKREPKTWKWVDIGNNLNFRIIEPTEKKSIIALKFELSDEISNDRIFKVLGDDISIWTIKIESPNSDCIQSTKDLENFRKVVRQALRKIKSYHGDDQEINIFPAMPISTAIEVGRVWMPKADLPMTIFDQNRSRDGFIKTIKLPFNII